MRTEQLEYVAAVIRLGSFRRAAEELHISQPALSETIRNLERELGVSVLERGRYGARVNDEGHELLPHIISILDAVDRLRTAADHQHRTSRVVRLGTVTTATAPLVAPAIRRFREAHTSTQVEVIAAQQDRIHDAIRDGSYDLGLVNYLDGDDPHPDFDTTPLLRGHAVVCMRPDSRLARRDVVRIKDLLDEPLISMRSGYVMHRYVHRLLKGQLPSFSYSADGAEFGKLLVAEGLGATVLPDFSVIGDPLEQLGAITYRRIEADDTAIDLVVQRRRVGLPPQAARDLHHIVVDQARIASSKLYS